MYVHVLFAKYIVYGTVFSPESSISNVLMKKASLLLKAKGEGGYSISF